MKLIWNLIKLIILIAVLSFVFRNFAARWALGAYLEHELGTRVDIKDVTIDFVNTQIKFDGLVIRNPLVFPDGVLADIPKLFIHWDPAPLLKGNLVFRTIELNVAEIRILNIPGNGLNLYALKIFRRELPSEDRDGGYDTPSSRKAPQFYIDQFILTLGKATFTDLTGANPYQKSVHLKLDHGVYRQVNGLAGIGEIVAWESLKRMGLGALSGLWGSASGSGDSGGSFIGSLFEKIKRGFQ